MRISILSVTAGSLLVLLGGGYYATEVYPRMVLHAALDQTFAAMPSGTTAVYQDARYSLVSRQATVTGLTIHGTLPAQSTPNGDAPLPYDLTIGSVTIAHPNLNLAELWAKRGAQPVQVADDISASDIAVHSALLDTTVGTFHVANPRVWPNAFPPLAAAIMRQPPLAGRASPESLEALTALLRLEAATLLSVAYDGYDATRLQVIGKTPALTLTYAVADIHAGAFDRGQFAGGAARGVTATSPRTGDISIDGITMGATDLRRPLTRVAAGEALSRDLLDGLSIGKIEYAGVAVRVPDQPKLEVGALSFGPLAFTGGWPVSGSLGWSGLRVAKSMIPEPQAQAAFDALGLEAATISAAFTFDWDLARQRLSVHDTRLAIKELGTLSMSLDLDRIQTDLLALMSQARFAHASLRFDDASLADRLLRMGAGMAGTDPATYRHQIATIAKLGGATAEAGSVMNATGGAAAAFIETPGTLTVDIAPPSPLPLLTLRERIEAVASAPNKAAPFLGVSATATGPR